jgi:hypothetical protein
MGDEDSPPDDSDHFAFPEWVPEDQRQAFINRVRTQQLNNHLLKHELYSLIEGLDEDGLRILSNWIANISSHPDPHPPLAYWQGYVTNLRQIRHGVCPVCDSTHEEQLLGGEEVGVVGTDERTPEA